MPFNFAAIAPLIQTGLGVLGNVLGGRSQSNAVGQASQINQQATTDAMSQILALYDQGRADLAPYRGVGQPALNRLQTLAGHPSSSIGALPQTTMPRPGAGTGMSSNALLGSQSIRNAVGTPVSLSAQKASNSSKNALLGGAGAAAGTVGLGLASGAMLGAPASFGLGLGLSALGGPIGLGLGALGSFVGSRIGRYNPDKAAASSGTDELSRQVWGTNTPNIPWQQLTSGLVADVAQGRKTVAQGRQEFERLWSSWIQGMKDAGVDDKIIQSSIASQRQYVFEPLKTTFRQIESQGVA